VLMANLTMFVTPSLIGVGKIQVFGTFAYQTAILLMYWPFASAYAITFIIIMGIIALLLQKGMGYLSRRAMGGQI
jgi:putative spermidine/putrescine transport system permease protein